jgi:hypothetical protein
VLLVSDIKIGFKLKVEGFLAFVGLCVAAVYFYKKTKKEEKTKWENWRMGKEEDTDAAMLINK